MKLFEFLVYLNIFVFERKLIIFGKNKSLLQAIHLSFFALEQQKGQQDLKSV
jgi:hypothetical protein